MLILLETIHTLLHFNTLNIVFLIFFYIGFYFSFVVKCYLKKTNVMLFIEIIYCFKEKKTMALLKKHIMLLKRNLKFFLNKLTHFELLNKYI